MGGRATTPKAARDAAQAAFAELKRRRRLHRLSQRQVAEALRVTPQLIAKLEAGQTTASLAQFIAYCAALDEDADCMLRRALRAALPAPAE